MPAPAIVQSTASGETELWFPSTLDQLGKYEEFLEETLAASPELLLLESRRTGIYGPFQVFRQLSMETPSGRAISPDIVILAASGHVIVVEVKRYVNSELRDRAVIAQIIDYASSFAALTEQQCVELFGTTETSTWTHFVEEFFPKDSAPDELASVLLNRMQRGELNLVIACDKVPSGLPDVVAGIVSQSALGFELNLLEVVPYVREVSELAEILFVPSTRLMTEIVSRTAVTVTYREGDSKPSTTVETTSMDNIEANLKSAKHGPQADAKIWTVDEVHEACRDCGHPVALNLFEFAKQHSAEGEVIAPGKKQNPSFGFYLNRRHNETSIRRMIFSCVVGWGGISLSVGHAEEISSEEVARRLRQKLLEIFGEHLDVNKKEVGLQFDILDAHWEDFQSLMLWLKSTVETTPEKP